VKWGVAQAINAGDVMYTLAFWALQRLDETTTAQTVLEASRCLQLVCLRLTEGQYLDLSYETRAELSLLDYWPMIEGKTSALLGGCAELGALAGGASSAQRAYFREFGIKLGLAFQVLDDWLGIWGEAALTGKSTESDLVSGKKTLPVLYALEKKGEFFNRLRAGPIRAQDVAEAAGLLKRDGAEAYTLDQAGRLTTESQEALRKAVPAEENAASLRELAGMLLKRKN
jgi:geranylgeranyl diphosphate synthase type I